MEPTYNQAAFSGFSGNPLLGHHLHPHASSFSDNQSQLSDTISESSDNATILSLSREDLTALGAGSIREDVRVSRKKLESLILQERDLSPDDKGFMETLMENSNTYIQWPSRMKIGAKTKKDLFVRIYAHNQEDINEAKYRVLQELGPQRDLRITLKLEVSYTDHSHLIGCRGATIRKVMEDTGCHIHFPDSNRMSKDHKSNQVTIAGGSIQAVEEARSRVRELSPLIFQFNLPIAQNGYEFMDPDAHHIFIDNVQTNYNVQISVHPPNKLQQTTVSVKGCEVDSAKIKEAVGQIINYFAPGTPASSVMMESAIEISAIQHSFVRAINDTNVHEIMMNTGAKVIFPDLTDNNIQQIKRSRIFISGDINSVYFARQQLIGCLPLRMIFDVNDDLQLDWDSVRAVGAELNVTAKLINRNRLGSGSTGATLPPPIPGRSRTLQLITAERNTGNIYEARRQILGSTEPPFIAKIPVTYALRSVHIPSPAPSALHQFGSRLNISPLKPLLLPSSPMSPLLSPSFWPPAPFVAPPFRSPAGKDLLSQENMNPPPGFRPKPQNLRYPGGGFNRSIFNYHSGLPGLGSPLHSTGVPMPLQIEKVDNEQFHHRKAPGFDRPNTIGMMGPPETPDDAHRSSGLNEKKLLAMKAIYQAKVGTPNRTPTSEWAGYGFSKTQMDLFSKGLASSTGSSKSTIAEADEDFAADELACLSLSSSASSSAWTTSSVDQQDLNNNNKGNFEAGVPGVQAKSTAMNQSETVAATNVLKTPLGPQQSNLFDLTPTTTKLSLDLPANDLPTLFAQNGLEKYIDVFVAEEIDCEAFTILTENDLRSLGVTSYPARKKMLILMKQLYLQLQRTSDTQWN